MRLRFVPFFVDSRLKEYSVGNVHEVTERLFVVQRAIRLNDALPQDSSSRWIWQRGGWLLFDRLTGRISPLNLPDFDPFFSTASWYRDYVAYCGLSDDGKKVSAIVAQVGRRKLILKKPLAEGESSAAGCPAPVWQRNPAKVIFQPAQGQPLAFSIRGRIANVISDAEEEAEE